MTLADTGIGNINITGKKKRGNGGANKGSAYGRMKIDDDMGRRFGKILMMILAASGISEYNSKYSNHLYSNWQKTAVLIFITFVKISLNSVKKNLSMYGGFIRSIGLKNIPDGSTLCKFQHKMPKETIEMLFPAFACAVSDSCTFITDCTAFSNFNRSAHYEFRCDQFGKKLPKRTFTKASIVIDKDTRLILSARSSVGNRHDITFTEEHLADLEHTGLNPSSFLADKGYDCEELHREIEKRLGCKAYIPVRQHRGRYGFSEHGMKRRMMIEFEKNRDAWVKVYGPRSVIESTNMMIKNLCGSCIAETKDISREIKALLKCLAYNVDCLFRLKLDKWFIRGFQ